VRWREISAPACTSSTLSHNTLAWAAAEAYAFAAAELQDEMEESARKQLAALVHDDDRRELDAQTVLRVSDTPVLAIVS